MLNVEFPDAANTQLDGDVQDRIRQILTEADQDVRSHLPDLPSLIHVTVHAGDEVIPETGEVGLCEGPDRIRWTINPWDDRGPQAIVTQRLRPTFFHEAHHAARYELIEAENSRLMDAVVFEGLATAFERDKAGSDPPYGQYDPDEARASIPELMDEPSHISRYEWFIQHRDGRTWIVYRTGTYIVDQVRRRSGETPASLAKTPTDEILQLSGLVPEGLDRNPANGGEPA